MWRTITSYLTSVCMDLPLPAFLSPPLSFITPESQSLTRLALNLLGTLDFAVRHSKVEAEALEKDLIFFFFYLGVAGIVFVCPVKETFVFLW